MSRRAAREMVLHLLFSNEYLNKPGRELLDAELGAERLNSLAAECELYEKPPVSSQREYIESSVIGVTEHIPELDLYIEKYSLKWDVGRISVISKCILRLSMYETLYMNIPVGASVNEALELAKRYDGEEAAAFINGIMGAFVKNELPNE